jgi:hypothetical protein
MIKACQCRTLARRKTVESVLLKISLGIRSTESEETLITHRAKIKHSHPRASTSHTFSLV